jgi:hypothetical protein
MSTRNFQREIGTRVRVPVEFGADTVSDYFQHLRDKTRRKEVVVWILIALLCALNSVAFYVMWLKANGSLAGWGEITSVAAPKNPSNRSVAAASKKGVDKRARSRSEALLSGAKA